MDEWKSGDVQTLFTALNGALETIQEECNRRDERITELEKIASKNDYKIDLDWTWVTLSL